MPEIIRRFGPFISINQSCDERIEALDAAEKYFSGMKSRIIDENPGVDMSKTREMRRLLREGRGVLRTQVDTPLEAWGIGFGRWVSWFNIQRRLTPDLNREVLRCSIPPTARSVREDKSSANSVLVKPS